MPGLDPSPTNVGTFVVMGNSAAGQNPAISRVTPAGSVEKYLSIFFDFVTNATVGNRDLAIEFFDPSGSHYGIMDMPVAQPASKTWIYTAAIGINTYTGGDSSTFQIELPDIWLPAGSTITIDSTGPGGASDQITNLNIKVLQQ